MYIIFTILGIFFVCLDAFKASTIKLTLGASFLFCAIIAHKFPQNLTLQLFSIPFFILMFNFLIKAVLKREKVEKVKLNKAQNYIGKTAVVTKDIGKTLSIDGLGMIKFGNQIWSAKSIDDSEIKAGKRVRIVSKENKIMNVEVVGNAKK